MFKKRMEELEIREKNRNNTDHSTVEIDQNIQKSPDGPRRPAVTHTSEYCMSINVSGYEYIYISVCIGVVYMYVYL